MLISEFSYRLPPDLIAQAPLPGRADSRLLSLEGGTGSKEDLSFRDLPSLISPGDLLVFNDTRVIPARLRGRKATGGAVEVVVERVLDDCRVLAFVRASKSPAPGSRLRLEDAVDVRVNSREQGLFELRFETAEPVLSVLERHGRVPLPPYIDRPAEARDSERYQTIYARTPGAVAAPTAGLHFDGALLDLLHARGVRTAHVTLHVGAGTFQPVRSATVEGHSMHSERLEVSPEAAAAVVETQARGARVIAVGTTSVRALEACASVDGNMRPLAAETDIFIYPGFRFRVVDAMITNFHLPRSTLLMLVCAFAGTAPVLAAYRHAVEQRYRFFSYGDAMFVTRAARVLEE